MRRLPLCLLLVAGASAWAQNGARLLVISSDALLNSIQPLAEWKQAAGISTKVVALSETGNDTTAIRNYIRDAWNNWPVKPEFVLLVGAQGTPPARTYRLWHGESYASDGRYGDVTGDYRQELPIGRFPAKSAAQLDVMVAKTLAYERKPDISDTMWTRRLTTVCRDQGDDDAPLYWADLRNAVSQAAANGFLDFDTLASSRGDDAADVVSSVSQGTGLVMYRGSATGNWYTPFAVNPASTTNGWKLPVVCSFTCATMTLNVNESMVGDAWVKAGTAAEPRGAVAFFGNTHSSVNVARQRSAVCRGFTAGLFTEHQYRLGNSCIRARNQLYQEYPTDTADYRGFNLFGDPSLAVWTGLPRVLTVEHPATIEPSPQVLDVVVSSAAGFEDSALVCASMDSTVYAWAYTNDSGVVHLDISPAATGSLRLVVTGHNLYPYDTLIPVEMTGISESDRLPVARGAELTAVPALFGNQVRFAWNPCFAGSTLDVVDALGRAVAKLASEGSEAIWSTAGLPAGAYVAVLAGPNGSALDRVRILKLAGK